MAGHLDKRASKARIGTRLRGALAEAYAARGNLKSILYVQYSAKARVDVALSSDLEYRHFLLAEADVAVKRIDYTPAKRVVQIAGDGYGTIVDAEVEYGDGRIEWREVKHSEDLEADATSRSNLQILIQQAAAAREKVSHAVYTEREINRHLTLISNWHRIAAQLAAARDCALDDYVYQITGFMRRHGRIEYRHALALGKPGEECFFSAALLQQVQFGRIGSDLDCRPFSSRSAFFVEDHHE